MPYYCLTLHNSKCIQQNEILSNEIQMQNIQMHIYSYNNTLKFKKNEEVVCTIKC